MEHLMDVNVTAVKQQIDENIHYAEIILYALGVAFLVCMGMYLIKIFEAVACIIKSMWYVMSCKCCRRSSGYQSI